MSYCQSCADSQREIVALRTALRGRVIFDQRKFLSGNNPGMQCDQCGKTWRHDQPERHATGCLAEQIEKDKGG